MLGFGGHFLTKSRRYSITFALLRNQRIVYRRTQTSGPTRRGTDGEPTTLVVNFLQFVGGLGRPRPTPCSPTPPPPWPESTARRQSSALPGHRPLKREQTYTVKPAIDSPVPLTIPRVPSHTLGLQL
jgi:hypothetical protein